MTIVERATKRGKARYRCDVCGAEDFWIARDWRWWGSYLMLDEIPEEVPTLCSDDCQSVFDRRLKEKTVEVRRVKPHGYQVRKIGERRGY